MYDPNATPPDPMGGDQSLLQSIQTAKQPLTAPKSMPEAPLSLLQRDGPDQDETPAPALVYQDFNLPHGLHADDEIMENFRQLAGQCGLDQDQAQEFINLQACLAERQRKAWVEQQTQWAAQAKADPEFGGARFWNNMAAARAAIDTFTEPGFMQVIHEVGLGSHPEIIRTLYRVGKAMLEESRPGLPSRGAKADPLLALYPSMQPK